MAGTVKKGGNVKVTDDPAPKKVRSHGNPENLSRGDKKNKGKVNKDTGLTDQQEMYAYEYCVDFNKTQAAIRAGASEKTAHSIGGGWHKLPGVIAIINRVLEERKEENKNLHDRIREELKLIAFSDITDLVKVGNSTIGVDNSVEIKGSELWKNKRGRLVKSIKVGRKGVELVIHDKLDAIEQLGKHTGFYKEDNDQKLPTGVNIYIPDNGRDKKQ